MAEVNNHVVTAEEGVEQMDVSEDEVVELKLEDLGHEITLYSLSNPNIRSNTYFECLNLSQTLKDNHEASGSNEIPLVDIENLVYTQKFLDKFTEWMTHHTMHPGDHKNYRKETCEEISEWDLEFIKTDTETIFALILLANFLDMKDLLMLCCKQIARNIQTMSEDEIREHYKIPKPEEVKEEDKPEEPTTEEQLQDVD